jgi:hypothetical protein
MTAPRPPRLFTVDDVLSGRANLDHIPFRYICVSLAAGAALSSGLGRSGANTRLDQLLSAAEMLEQRGWELMTVEQGGTLAYLRRVTR